MTVVKAHIGICLYDAYFHLHNSYGSSQYRLGQISLIHICQYVVIRSTLLNKCLPGVELLSLLDLFVMIRESIQDMKGPTMFLNKCSRVFASG